MSVLESIEPKEVFGYFEEICGIPHGSGDTWRISNYLVEFAEKRELKYIQDTLGNVIIFKPGTPGYETSEPVMLQGHMDMVCEKDSDTDIDFAREGLKLCLEGNVISAEGTTLGGDDGIAVAYALAILDAGDGICHPPLEVVITVDEEIGMLGAAGLDCSPLHAKRMLNLDSEDEGQLLVSCAGGVTAVFHLPVQYTSSATAEASGEGLFVRLEVTGASGGHSGVEIDRQGANASKVLGRILYCLSRRAPFCLISLNGGLKDNAIPREAYAELIISSAGNMSVLSETIEEYNDILTREFGATDPDICIRISKPSEIQGLTECMTRESTARVISTLVNLPNGVQRMSKDIEGLVQTSLNLGIMKTGEIGQDKTGEVSFGFSVRSSMGTEKEELTLRLQSLAEAMGGTLSLSGDYPAWEYRKNSQLRDIMVEVYEDMFGTSPRVQAIHAGVECGLFAGKISGLDCVSYGPQMDDIHTPSERLYADSVKRTWDYTLEILRRLQ